MNPDTVNMLINSITGLVIAFGGLSGWKLVRNKGDQVAEKTEESGTRIVDELASLRETMTTGFAELGARVTRLEEGAQRG